MVKEIVKINDTTVAIISENKRIFSSTDLANSKTSLERQLAEINELIAVLNAA